MNHCNHCQKSLLPYLYDLLEEAEGQGLREHLDGCPACLEALEQARSQQTILAQATKESFPAVSFQPPVEKIPLPQPTLPFARRPKHKLVRWALAASVLGALIGGYLAFAGWKSRHDAYERNQARLTRSTGALSKLEWDIQNQENRLQTEIQNVTSKVDHLLKSWPNEEEKVRHKFVHDQTNVTIECPASLQAGAKNDIHIHVARPMPAPGGRAVRLRAKVIHPETKNVLLEKEIGDAGLVLTLPPDLPLKPGTPLALLIEGQDAKGLPFQMIDHLSLVAPEYVTHLYLDRPMYRPGETVRFRSLTLERFLLKPAQEVMHLRFVLKDDKGTRIAETEKPSLVADPVTGELILGPDGQPVKGLAVGEFPLPPTLAKGKYTLEVSEVYKRFPTEKRAFFVNQWEPSALIQELHFDRSSYGPGETVQIHGSAKRAGKPEMFIGHVQVVVDGALAHQAHFKTDMDGKYRAGFSLPPNLERGDGMVTVHFKGTGVRDSITRPLSLVANQVLIDFYPEGGNLVAGVPNRVYFQARTPLGKPADVEGIILDERDNVVAKAATLTDDAEPGINQGMGRFEIEPKAGSRYRFKVLSPKRLAEPGFDLPTAEEEGLALLLPHGVVKEQIEVDLYSTRDRDLLVGAYCRGKLLDHAPLRVLKGQKASVALHAPPALSGVYRITVFEKIGVKEYHPLAERLIYNQGGERLDLSFRPSQKVFHPRDKVDLDLEVRTEKKVFAPSILLVSVVDQNLMKLADDRTLRHMPSHFLLTSEVRRPEDLENVDVLLGPHPKAGQALDLLLGVQGWRRFAEQNPARFHEKHSLAAARLLPGLVPEDRKKVDAVSFGLEQLKERKALHYVELQKDLARLEREEENETQRKADIPALREKARNQVAQADSADEELRDYQAEVRCVFVGLGILGLTALGLVLLGWLVVRGPSALFQAGKPAFIGLGFGALLVTGLWTAVFWLSPAEKEEGNAPDWLAEVKTLAPPKAGAGESPKDLPPKKGFASEIAPIGDLAKVPVPLTAVATKSVPDKTADKTPLGGPAPKKGFLDPSKSGSGGFGGATGPVPGLAPVPPGVPHPVAPVSASGPFPGGVPPLPPPSLPTAKTGLLAPGAMDVPGGPGGIGGGMAAPRMGIKAGAEANPLPTVKASAGGDKDDRALRRSGKYKELLHRYGAREEVPPELLSPSVVREFAYRSPDPEAKEEKEYAELLLWLPIVVAKDGTLRVSFSLSDLASTYQVIVFAHGPDGRLGAGTFEIPVQKTEPRE